MNTTTKFYNIKMIVILLVVVVTITGCSNSRFELNSLTRPPVPLGDVGKVQLSIEKMYGQDVQFKYPESGDYRSAIVLHDIDADGKEEAFAVCKINSADQFLNLLILKENSGSYNLIKSFCICSENVERICFGDVDGDKKNEIVIGWSNGDSVKDKISVYDFSDNDYKEKNISDTYTEMLLTDIDDDGIEELFIVYSDIYSEGSPCAKVLKFNAEGKEEEFDTTGVTNMVAKLSNVHLRCGMISSSQKGVFIEGNIKGRMFTDIVYWDKSQKKLINPLYGKNNDFPLASREIEVYSEDVNDDGVVEIPYMFSINTSIKSKGLFVPYKLDWVQFNEVDTPLKQIKSVICNFSEKYCFDCPSKWCDENFFKIYAVIDDNERTMKFSENVIDENGHNASGVDLVTIKVYSEYDWKASNKDSIKIFSDNENVYVIDKINLEHEMSISNDEIINSFQKIKNL